MMRAVFALLLLVAATMAPAAEPYDEAADAHAAIRATIADAQRAHVPVLIVFGANWCADCRILDTAFKTGASAPLIQKNFRVVKVDVGKFNKNLDVAEAYDVPIRRGIPAVAVLSQEGKVIYATRGGELADARKMGDDGIYAFFAKVANSAR